MKKLIITLSLILPTILFAQTKVNVAYTKGSAPVTPAQNDTLFVKRANGTDIQKVLVSAITQTVAIGDWHLTGNSGTTAGTNFLGTTDAQDVVFKRNSSEVMRLYSSNNFVGIGTSTPLATLHVQSVNTLSTSATYNQLNFNGASTPIKLFGIRNDGFIYAGLINGSMTIGSESGFNEGLVGNTFLGVSVGGFSTLTTGNNNTSVGFQSLKFVTTGSENCAIGTSALLNNSTGTSNNAIGNNCMALTGTGGSNNAMGASAMASNTTGFFNSAFGHSTMSGNTTGARNTAFGARAYVSSGTGNYNVALGFEALQASNSSDENTAIGANSLFSATAGQNTALGYEAGVSATSGNNNVFLGYKAGHSQTTASNQLFIDNQNRGSIQNDKDKSLIYGNFNANELLQIIVLNGVLYMKDTAAPNHYWSGVIVGGVLTWTDTGSSNAP